MFLVSFMSTQHVICEEGSSIEKMPPPAWPIDKPVRINFLIDDSYWWVQLTGTVPPLRKMLVLDALRKQPEQPTRTPRRQQHSHSFCFGVCLWIPALCSCPDFSRGWSVSSKVK